MTLLYGNLVITTALSDEDRASMYALLCKHFKGTSFRDFLLDLEDKQHVIVLRNHQDKICGFSTQSVFEHRSCGSSCRIIFSGDTIIDPSHWGSLELSRIWISWVLALWEQHPSTPLYWMLISKGFRTYRFLPSFFKEFYPRIGMKTPPEVRSLITDLTKRRFPTRWKVDRGFTIVSANSESQRLSDHLAVIPDRYLKSPDVQFFLKANRNWRQGSELVCIASCSPDNIRRHQSRLSLTPQCRWCA
jgi:hypothetical protein